MSLNSWLCMNFDRDNKKYVRPLDIVWVILDDYGDAIYKYTMMFSIWVMISMFLSLPQNTLPSQENLTVYTFVAGLLSAWIVPFEYIVPTTIALYAFYKFMGLKIAKCPRRKDE